MFLEIYYEIPMMINSSDRSEQEFVSGAMQIQLKFITSKVITKLEVEILSEIDKSARGTGALGRRSPIVFWVCLLLVMFSYKGQKVYAAAFHQGKLQLLRSRSSHLTYVP
jgi:hypothetical protein